MTVDVDTKEKKNGMQVMQVEKCISHNTSRSVCRLNFWCMMGNPFKHKPCAMNAQNSC